MEAEEFSVNKEIRINIQGVGTNEYERTEYGIDTVSDSYRCYALHTEDFREDDRIIYNGNKFVIKNLNQNIYGGQLIFWDFLIVKESKEANFTNS